MNGSRKRIGDLNLLVVDEDSRPEHRSTNLCEKDQGQ
jgi:hypothetical protein